MADTRPVIYGTCPPSEGLAPFSPRTPSGQRLCQLAGLSYLELRKKVRLVNLSSHPIEDRTLRRKLLADLADAVVLDPNACYVLCGHDALRAFGGRILPVGTRRDELPPFEWWWSKAGPKAALFPHPSGRSHFYNPRETRAAAAKFLRDLLDPAWEETCPTGCGP